MGYCLKTRGGGGGWPAPADPPALPHQKNFPPAKKNLSKGPKI